MAEAASAVVESTAPIAPTPAVGGGLPGLVAQAYEAACDPAGLQRFVSDATAYFGADSGAYVIWPALTEADPVAIRHNFPDAPLSVLADPGDAPASLLGRIRAAQPGAVIPDHGPPPPGWPAGEILIGVVDNHSPNHCALIFLARRGFSGAACESLQHLLVFLRRATDVNKRFVQLFANYQVALHIMDSVSRGIMVFGQQGQLIYVNAEAKRIIQGDNGINAAEGQLLLGCDIAKSMIDDFLERARAQEDTERGPVTQGIRIEREDGHGAFQLLLFSVPCKASRAALNPDEALAVGIVHDPSNGVLPGSDLLAVFFGLTPAEADLTRALCSGLSVQEIAEELSVSVHTARTHLRNIFAKVGVHSQHALVQRISQSLYDASQSRSPLK